MSGNSLVGLRRFATGADDLGPSDPQEDRVIDCVALASVDLRSAMRELTYRIRAYFDMNDPGPPYLEWEIAEIRKEGQEVVGELERELEQMKAKSPPADSRPLRLSWREGIFPQPSNLDLEIVDLACSIDYVKRITDAEIKKREDILRYQVAHRPQGRPKVPKEARELRGQAVQVWLIAISKHLRVDQIENIPSKLEHLSFPLVEQLPLATEVRRWETDPNRMPPRVARNAITEGLLVRLHDAGPPTLAAVQEFTAIRNLSDLVTLVLEE